ITATQDSLLAVIREVQRRRQRPAPGTLPKLFSAAARFICTVPELDPYRKQRHEPAAGPFSPVPPPMPFPKKSGFFAYLAADAPTFKSAVMGLAAVPFPGSFYIRRPPDSIVKMLTGKGHHVYPTPAPIIDVLREVPLIAHHGGVGTTETALGIGRPQLLFPRHLEQKLTAAALTELGVGLAPPREADEKLVVALVQKLVKEQPHGARAQKFAHTLQARGSVDNVARIVERCCEIIGSRATAASA
ncbi:MAG: glycosyltransferase, partial [Dongiaceae bacterium]